MIGVTTLAKAGGAKREPKRSAFSSAVWGRELRENKVKAILISATMKTHHSGTKETAHNKGKIRKPKRGRLVMPRPPGDVAMSAMGYAIKAITTINPARLTIPARLRIVARMSAQMPPMMMGRRSEFPPPIADGTEISSMTKRAGMIWLPVRPRRKRSFSLNEADCAGLGGEAIRYHQENNLFSRCATAR